MNRKAGIIQLTELCVAIAAMIRAAMDTKESGKKLTTWGIIKILWKNRVKLIAASGGIDEIPAELADIQPEEMDVIYWAVILELKLPEHSIPRDVFNLFFNTTFHAVNNYRIFMNTIRPPKAEVVPE